MTKIFCPWGNCISNQHGICAAMVVKMEGEDLEVRDGSEEEVLKCTSFEMKSLEVKKA